MSRGLSRFFSSTGWISAGGSAGKYCTSCSLASLRARAAFRLLQMRHPSVYSSMSPPQPLQAFRGRGIPRESPTRTQWSWRCAHALQPRVRSSAGAPQLLQVSITCPSLHRGGPNQSWRFSSEAGSASPHWGNTPDTSYGERGGLTHASEPYSATTERNSNQSLHSTPQP